MAEDNVTRLPVTPRPRAIGAVVQNIIGRLKSNTATATAHDYAEAFHAAMARALRLSDDIEDIKRDLRQSNFRSIYAGRDDELADIERRYRDALHDASVALDKMPAVWAAVLSGEVPPSPEAA